MRRNFATLDVFTDRPFVGNPLAVVLDADGAAVIPQERVEDVLEAARARAENERVKRAKLAEGALSYDLDGLRALVEG